MCMEDEVEAEAEAEEKEGHRHWLDPILVTTYPHVIVAIIASSNLYALMVLTSTAFSILWHRHREPSGFLFVMDYGAASLWGLVNTLIDPYTLALNVPVAIANPYIDHSWWHLLHVIKAVLVVTYIQY